MAVEDKFKSFSFLKPFLISKDAKLINSKVLKKVVQNLLPILGGEYSFMNILEVHREAPNIECRADLHH